MTSRGAFLERIRSRLQSVAETSVEIPPDWAVEVDDPLRRFEVELVGAGGRFYLGREAEVGDVVAEILKPFESPRVVVTREAGIPEAAASAVQSAGGEVLWWPEAGRKGAAGAHVGITAALWGAAETGTILLSSAPPSGRAPSLLPRVHVAFLARDRIVPTVADLFACVAGMGERPSNLVLVTGPSKTADIENVLVRGVHGPAEAHVIVTQP
jgi:L-lactate dehydrogenase complex protein LldG